MQQSYLGCHAVPWVEIWSHFAMHLSPSSQHWCLFASPFADHSWVAEAVQYSCIQCLPTEKHITKVHMYTCSQLPKW